MLRLLLVPLLATAAAACTDHSGCKIAVDNPSFETAGDWEGPYPFSLKFARFPLIDLLGNSVVDDCALPPLVRGVYSELPLLPRELTRLRDSFDGHPTQASPPAAAASCLLPPMARGRMEPVS